MRKEPVITLNEVVAELERLGAFETHNGTGNTVEELCDLWGCSNAKVRSLLRKAQQNNLLVVGKQPRIAINNTRYIATVYSITKPKSTPSTKRKK